MHCGPEWQGATYSSGLASDKICLHIRNELAKVCAPATRSRSAPTECMAPVGVKATSPSLSCDALVGCQNRCSAAGGDSELECMQACQSAAASKALATLKVLRACEDSKCPTEKLGFVATDSEETMTAKHDACSRKQCTTEREQCGLPVDAKAERSRLDPNPKEEAGKQAAPDTPAAAANAILDDTTDPTKAAQLARDAYLKHGRTSRRTIASAANTRGHRLYQVGKHDDALPLFVVAATMDPTYGMPRFNAARVYALKNDVTSCVKYLLELRRLGRAQRDRLAQARKDEGFKNVWGDQRFQAVLNQ
jgi:hypothetical protein